MRLGLWVSPTPPPNVTFSEIHKSSSKIRELNKPINKLEGLPEQNLGFTAMDEGGTTVRWAGKTPATTVYACVCILNLSTL